MTRLGGLGFLSTTTLEDSREGCDMATPGVRSVTGSRTVAAGPVSLWRTWWYGFSVGAVVVGLVWFVTLNP